MDLLERIRRAVGNRYTIEREAGRGGMSVVFLAQDLKHDRRVALKVLRPELAGSLATDRFLQEIRISAGLQHPNILQLLDSGQADGLPFCVLPYMDGETLRDRLGREHQLGIDQVVRIVQEVSDALEYAHGKEVIHRDIKPSNIFLSGDHTFVGDFGVAKALSVAGGARLTQSGFAIGTPSYMSPEQATGGPHLDGRSDVYSLGCMTFEMLAGEPPFSGPTGAAIIAKQASQEAPPLRVVRPRVPWGIEQAVEKALAKVPADRFSTATRFAQALSAGRENPTPPRRIVQVADAISRRWAFSAALAYTILVALGLLVLGQPGGLDAVTEPLLAKLTVSLFSLIPLVAAVGWALDPGIRREASAAGGEGPESSGHLHRFVRWRGGPLILSGLVSACLMVILWPSEPPPVDGLDGPLKNHVAIIYFETPGGEEGLQRLAYQITDKLIGEFTPLQEISPITVYSSTAVMESREGLQPPLEFAKNLRAEFLVHGSVDRSGDSIVVHFSLDDPWSGIPFSEGDSRADASGGWDSSTAQRMAEDLARQLRRVLGDAIREREIHLPAEPGRASEELRAAHAQFTHARRVLVGTDEGDVLTELDRAGAGFEAAARLDPNWPEPHICLGRVAEWRALFLAEFQDSSDPAAAVRAVNQGLESLERALALEAENPRALAQKGDLLYLRWSNITDLSQAQATLEEAEESLRAAVDGDPTLVRALSTLSQIHLAKGEFQQAKIRALAAMEADVFLEDETTLSNNLALAFLNLGEDQNALDRCRDVQMTSDGYPGYECELEVLAWGENLPADPVRAQILHDTILYLGRRERQPSFRARVLFELAGVLGRAGLWDRARIVLEEGQGYCPEDDPLWQEAGAHVRVGDFGEAISVLERLLALDPVRGSGDLNRQVFLPLSDEPGFLGLSDHSPG